MTPQLLPLLLLLLAGPPTAQPVPPTCYSRMLALSREITADFQSLQATEPSVSALGPPEDWEVHADPVLKNLPLDQGKSAIFLFWSMLISRVFVFYSQPIKSRWFALPFKYKENIIKDISIFVYN